MTPNPKPEAFTQVVILVNGNTVEPVLLNEPAKVLIHALTDILDKNATLGATLPAYVQVTDAQGQLYVIGSTWINGFYTCFPRRPGPPPAQVLLHVQHGQPPSTDLPGDEWKHGG